MTPDHDNHGSTRLLALIEELRESWDQNDRQSDELAFLRVFGVGMVIVYLVTLWFVRGLL